MLDFVVTVVVGAIIMAVGVELGRNGKREARRAEKTH